MLSLPLLLQKTLDAFCRTVHIAEHTLKTTGLARLSHFTGEETKFQRLGGQWFGQGTTVLLEIVSGHPAQPYTMHLLYWVLRHAG